MRYDLTLHGICGFDENAKKKTDVLFAVLKKTVCSFWCTLYIKKPGVLFCVAKKPDVLFGVLKKLCVLFGVPKKIACSFFSVKKLCVLFGVPKKIACSFFSARAEGSVGSVRGCQHLLWVEYESGMWCN